MERKQLSVLFFIKRTRILKNGESKIRIRITYDGFIAETQTNRSINPKLWSQPKGCSIGKDRVSNELNAFLETIRMKIHQIQHDLERSGELYSATVIRDNYSGNGIEAKTLYSVFKDHNERCRKLIGVDYVDNTVSKYDRCLRYLMEFIKIRYGKDDVNFCEVTPDFISNFEVYVKTEKKSCPNTATRHLKHLKKILLIAIANGWMVKNPFNGRKLREVEVNKEFLSQQEIKTIIDKEFNIERLSVVRDVFVFCCFTGLAFVDVCNLRKEHIETDNKGNVWIRKARAKTDVMCNIPLLLQPKRILEKYKSHPICITKGVLLPVVTNQKMNSYLKEIADVCGITKHLTTHTARHTFASVVALGNNVALTNVAKMLGHSSTKMTQRYAKVLDSSIMRDMEIVEAVLADYFG